MDRVRNLSLLVVLACSQGVSPVEDSWTVGVDVDSIDAVSAPDSNHVDLGDVGTTNDVEVVEPVVPGPEIDVAPVKLDFGLLAPAESKTLAFRVDNLGDEDLIISSVHLRVGAESSVDGFDVTTLPAGPEIVRPGDDGLLFTVTVTVTASQPLMLDLSAFLEVASNDVDEATLNVLLVGTASGPLLQFNPENEVDFGHVGLDASSVPGELELIVTNMGATHITVSDLRVADNTTGEFSLAETPPSPFVLGPGNYRKLVVRFTNGGGPFGEEVEANLRFESDDPAHPGTRSLPLRATRGMLDKCILSFGPGPFNYGPVEYGATKSMTFTVTNIGSGPCTPVDVRLMSTTEEATDVGGVPKCVVPSEVDDTFFEVTSAPPLEKDFLKPSDSADITITFKPTMSGPATPFSAEHYKGFVQVIMADHAQANAITGEPFVLVTTPSGSPADEVPCNLMGRSGTLNLTVGSTPDPFPLTTVGCKSEEDLVRLDYNGTLPYYVCNIELVGCDDQFEVFYDPSYVGCDFESGWFAGYASPWHILEVRYTPKSPGAHECALVVHTTDVESAELVVPLSGTATTDDTQTDSFTQLSGNEVDVLFVVDDSASMSDNLMNIKANLSAFATLAESWSRDIHMGLVGTNSGSIGGNPYAALAGVGQRFFTSATGLSGFVQTIESLAADDESPQGVFDAANAATTKNKTDAPPTPDTPCQADSDCIPQYRCVTSVYDPTLTVCAGQNWEFIRPTAGLEIVLISDEEDTSYAAVDDYVNVLQGVKGPGNTDLVQVHSVTGGAGCTSAWGTATAGPRFEALSDATGGMALSICEPDWATALGSLGDAPGGLQVEFSLSRSAKSGTLQVKLDGVKCTEGWTFQKPSNTVRFDPDGPCMPKANQSFAVEYEVVCVPP